MRKSRSPWQVRFVLPLVALAAAVAAIPPAPARAQIKSIAATPTYAGLAAYWAPVISQDMDDTFYLGDYITVFDYDGDWKGNNNWNNIEKFRLPSNVYWWVMETETHYFIGYAFFHPRDWDDGWFPDEHENDLEGILLTIQKGSNFYGHFQTMVTVAHTDFYSYTDQDTPASSPWFSLVAPSQAVTNGKEDIDGDVDFVADNFGFHPVVYVEAKGHGVYGTRGSVTDSPPIFDANRVTDWQGVTWSGMPFPPGVSTTKPWADGILYHYEGVSDHPAASLLHNWEVAGYNLVSIKEMWTRRFQPETFDHFGTFDGDDGGEDKANAPWGWDDEDDGPVHRGDMFHAPVTLVDRYFSNLGPYSYWCLGTSYQ